MTLEEQIADWLERTKEACLNGTLTPEQIAHLQRTGFRFPIAPRNG